jgi:hypothetical protein
MADGKLGRGLDGALRMPDLGDPFHLRGFEREAQSSVARPGLRLPQLSYGVGCRLRRRYLRTRLGNCIQRPALGVNLGAGSSSAVE